MEIERRLVRFVHGLSYSEIPSDVVDVVKNVIFTVIATAIAGAREEGIETLLQYYTAQGGRGEATVFVHGERLPAEHAALLNAIMARALDFCDAMVPGLHMGSTAVPTALSAAELVGATAGKDFLSAIAVGMEVGSRLNLSEAAYDGFDPTGVCGVFISTCAASRILRLSERETLNALGLCFNRAAGSFQSNIDGSLAVRIIQGWTAETGIRCARYAKAGLTGPENFLTGVYGFYHLFGKDLFSPYQAVEGLGDKYVLKNVVFKKYPSCGLTQGSIEVALELVKEGLRAEEVESIEVRVPPYAKRLVGHDFKIGANPRVDAQFSIQYCVASALLRGSCRLKDFQEDSVRDPALAPLIARIRVEGAPELEKVDHTAVRMEVLTKDGRRYVKMVRKAPGFPGNPLSAEDHRKRFMDCMEYAGVEKRRADEILSFLENIEDVADVRQLLNIIMC
jgi:2-methylcitrate dehydratase PrpD